MSNLYVLAGGGSGGHLTPLIPVSESIKKLDRDASVIHIGQKGDSLNAILKGVASIDRQYFVLAGKYRRYNGESIIKRVIDLKTFALNIRDLFYFLIGIFQSWRLLNHIKPDVIFTKGGFVCAPVGIAAKLLNIPYVTHDSDAMVSLAHRIIAKNASLHLTAMPSKFYSKYDSTKVLQVGVPVRKEYKKITQKSKSEFRITLGFNDNDKILLALGGGLGAKNINDAIVAGSRELLVDEQVKLIHITGDKLYEDVAKAYDKELEPELRKRVVCLNFTNELYIYSGTADVIVTRAGATNMAEFAAQAKACIVVPNPLLAGGHQLKNAVAYEELGSAIVVNEQDASSRLIKAVIELLNDKNLQIKLGGSLHSRSLTGSAGKIAEQLVAVVRHSVKL